MKRYRNIAIISLNGELDSHSADKVQGALGEWVKPDCRIVLDLEQVPFLSSAGLRILLTTYRDVEAQNGHMILAGLDNHLKDVMEATGFLQYFELADDIKGGMDRLESLT